MYTDFEIIDLHFGGRVVVGPLLVWEKDPSNGSRTEDSFYFWSKIFNTNKSRQLSLFDAEDPSTIKRYPEYGVGNRNPSVTYFYFGPVSTVPGGT